MPKDVCVVLMTARIFYLLQKMERDCIEMPELEESEGRSLLLYHAAPSNHVNVDVLRQCLQRCYFRKDDDDDDCDLLPIGMALEELGLQSGNDADQWTEELHTHIQVQEKEHSIYSVMRKRFDEHPLFSILKKSFDALSKEDQTLFMDAALFYPRDSFVDPSWNISTLDWMHMVHGGSVEDIKARVTIYLHFNIALIVCSFLNRHYSLFDSS